MASRLRSLLRKTFPLYRPALSGLGMLDYLARGHATDKFSHGYTRHYGRHFRPLRFRKLKLLEIGIGGYDRPDEGGTSLKMWRDYFPRGEIFGLDLHDKSGLHIPRVKIFQGDQNDPQFLHEFATKWGPFDIIIDDGSHISEHIITSFRALFPHVKPGGIYAVEDLFFSYDPNMGGSAEDFDTPTTSMGLLKSLVDEMHSKYILDHTPENYGDQIVGLEFYPKLCFIRKGDNAVPDRTVEAFYARRPRQAPEAEPTAVTG